MQNNYFYLKKQKTLRRSFILKLDLNYYFALQ